MWSPRLVDRLFVFAAFFASLPFVVASHESSATFDEPFYLDAGLTSWRTGSNKMLMKAGTMPLPVELQTLPLHLGESREFGDGLRVARRVNLAFWFALLAFGFAVAKQFAGSTVARWAVVLLAAEPNLLAHAGLATTDIAVTAGCLAATSAFVAGRDRSAWRRIVVPGIAYGVAMLCKASALAFVPMIWACVGLFDLVRRGAFRSPQPGLLPWLATARRATVRLRWEFVLQALIGFVVVFAYCGSDWQRERTFVEWAHGLADGPGKAMMVAVSERLTVFTNAGEALAQQIKHNMRGHGSYVAGHWHPRAVWWYFVVALAVKLTLPVLATIVIAAVGRWRDWFGSPLGWICLVLLLFTVNCRVQIGVRLVFPLVTFLLIASVATLAKSRWGVPVVAATIVGQFAFTAWHRDDLLRHANPLFGGPANVHRWLSDSNADWGQGLPKLETWADGRAVAIWYFGTDPRADRPPLGLVQFHQFPATATVEDFQAALSGRPLAVGTSILFDNPHRSPAGARAVEWIKGLEPIDRVGPFFIVQP
jgi:hypothetical protein